MAVKAFEVLVLFEDSGKGMETALEWLGGSPAAYGVFLGMVREMVLRDIPASAASYVSSVKESAARHFGVMC